MTKKEMKTNAMRILDKEQVTFEILYYECDDFLSGVDVADKMGESHELVYKTLVCVGKSKDYYVFVIPIEDEIDLKKAAKAVNEKALEMLHLKDLTKVTGYIRGGTTAIGMKKQFPTIVHFSAELLDKFYVSGGKPGTQVKLSPKDFMKITNAKYYDIIKD
ncbi:MAG: Cys-tRNA(Pro) deacylase [Suipraeoptans sp.]